MEITTKQEKISLIESAFGESSLANSGKNVSVVCPVCKEDSRASSKKKKLSICLEKGIYHCWVCESKGKNVASFAFKNASIDNQTKAKLSEAFNLQQEVEKEKEIVIRLPSDFRLLYLDSTRQGKIAKRYLHKRGCNPDDLLRFKIGISNESEYVNRIIIPSFSEDMKLNFFLSRSYDENSIRKYKNCDGKKTEIIFNEHLIDWKKPVVLVEGVFDAIKSIENTIPILGSWIDESHYVFQKIVKNNTPVVLGMDPDAIQKTIKMAKNLASFGVDVKICKHKEKDFGDMTKEEVKFYIENSKKYEISDRIEYLIKNISSGSIF
jgi:DNA primase